MSGKALVAGDSSSQPPSSLRIRCGVSITLCVFSLGCGAADATPPPEIMNAIPAPIEIDAGVIFSDRGSYLCVPLARFGQCSADKVESIDTSCECVTARLIRYMDRSAKAVDGVLLEFVADEAMQIDAPRSMDLGVVVTVTTSEGKSQTATLILLRTHFFTEEEAQQ